MARNDRFAPAALALTPCARCATFVESVDARRCCDDCAGAPPLAAVASVPAVGLSVARAVGLRSFVVHVARREAARVVFDVAPLRAARRPAAPSALGPARPRTRVSAARRSL